MEVLTILIIVLGGLVLLSVAAIVISFLLSVIGPPETLDYNFEDDEI